MAFHFLLATLLAIVPVCAGQDSFRVTNTDRSVSTCDTINLQWTGGTPPFTVTILDEPPQIFTTNARRKLGDVLRKFPPTTTRSQIWTVDDLSQLVEQVLVQIEDSKGEKAFPKLLTINRLADLKCSSSSSSSSAPTSTSSLTVVSSSVPPTASSTPSQPVSTSSSSASSLSASNFPTSSTPSSPSETASQSTPSSKNSAVADRKGAVKSSSMSVTAIVGIAVGGIIALVLVILGIYCFRRQTKAKSDPLDSWDGGYDPESVFKATAQFEGSGRPGTGHRVAESVPLWNPTRTQSRDTVDSADSPPMSMTHAPLGHNQPMPQRVPYGHSPQASLSMYQSSNQSAPMAPMNPYPPVVSTGPPVPVQTTYTSGKNIVLSAGAGPVGNGGMHSRSGSVIQELDGGPLARGPPDVKRQRLPPSYDSIPRS